MTILHIFKDTNQKFYEPYIKFINNNYNYQEHFFMIEEYDSRQAKDFYSNNIEYVSKSQYIKLLGKLYLSDKIILHGLMSPRLMILIYLQPWLLKKCYWVIWGVDLYYYRKEKRTIKSKLLEIIRKKVIRNMGSIISLVKGDYDLAVKWYGTNAIYYHGMYVTPINMDYLNTLPEATNKEILHIQIGNSGDPANQHMEALKLLESFKAENIKIFMPISYGGTEEYKKEIIDFGTITFGDKFVPMLEFLKADEYASYLSSIDIAIFNNNRQQALGNIFALLYLGKKVYIRTDTVMWEHFTDFLNLDMYKLEEIKRLNFVELSYQQNNSNNKKKIKEIVEEKNLVKIWNDIFSENT